MPKHHDLTGPIPHFSGLHPYIDNPQPDWQPRQPERAGVPLPLD
jgi:hypothetical protein